MSPTPFTATGRFDTPNGSKYLQQLCKHFAHKVPASHTDTEGRVEFSIGLAEMRADETGLTVTVTGDSDENLGHLKEVIDSHLKRFAFREEFSTMDW